MWKVLLVFGAQLGPVCFASGSLAQSAPASVTLDDAAIRTLAEKFAPEVMHASDEPNKPANVDWFLSRTVLSFTNDHCAADKRTFGQASLKLLSEAKVASACEAHTFTASGTRSADRHITFTLNDLSDNDRRGPEDPALWTTYFHAFLNHAGGINLQYWTFYPYNTGKKVGPVEIGFHGGDWEMAEVVLDSTGMPTALRTTGHTTIEEVPWKNVQTAGSHPILFSEKGGHELHASPQDRPPFIVHQTWTGGTVTSPGLLPRGAGPLIDLGTKLEPKVQFLEYSGLWGSLGSLSSGYWGPAFNETGMPSDSFLAVWCDGIRDPMKVKHGTRECYPDDVR